ncbi:hypothetical protein [Glaciimonas sp. PAMC28666]|uniref:hypothetical protein n=1 Tax=Glaciimonas sp. PAMC28666 TaxID=2807626 RepID=UPI0019648EDC|nr:hypothetical protein [Glaciimonas sp. PAMC28666]QRX83341.1 hypothetical protein JQN73_03465 [Glaciimonas sp. PAMC28666]
MNILPSGETPPPPRMSIAISALVLPSRVLFALASIVSIAGALISVLVGLGFIGRLPPISGAIFGFFGLSISLIGWLRYQQAARPLRLNISSAGQISIRELLPDAMGGSFKAPVLAQLLSGSTLWAHCLLLRFQLNNGQTKSVVILPDCVPENIFRSTSVACRWIASRGHANGQKKV